ncbi:MAG TPA: methyltransferase domain-containing protein [Gemmatimonadales bacterium]|nr:methyltransferase domain-containing protein [Gemmatimonadales bacterium]
MLTISRVGCELLDDPAAPADTVAVSLGNIARSNRWFGGTAALRYGLGRVLGGISRGSTVSLLDIGTGLGDLPRAAARWAARRGVRVEAFGLERNPVAARLARSRGFPVVIGCAGTPPLADKSVDVVTANLVAHHFEPDSVVELFRVCDRLARIGVVICDLRRAALGVLAFRVGARLLRFDPVTVADGVTSIHRGFTRAELGGLLQRAGVRGRIVRRPGWRFVATWSSGLT